jgi:hypothetical protein
MRPPCGVIIRLVAANCFVFALRLPLTTRAGAIETGAQVSRELFE